MTKTFESVARRSVPLVAAVVLAVLCVGPAFSQHVNREPVELNKPTIPLQQRGPIAQSALDQIGALLQEKEARSSAERKISSQLMYALHAGQGQVSPPLAKLYANAREAIAPGGADTAKLTITARVTVTLLKQIESLGGTLIYSVPERQTITANMPLAAIATIAANPNVFRISAAPRVTTNAGALTTQGYISHKAREAIAGGHNGTGVKVGVLSDSADSVAMLIASGDLPPDTVIVPGQSGDPGSSEGTAMMEIVHDMAPGAKLFFATAFTSPESMADNIRTLRFTYGCDIIVDDVSWSNEGVFQDTTVALAVNDVVADGALYFSSAGNNGNLTNGNATAWEGDFVDSGITAATLTKTYKLHDFGGQAFDRMLANGAVVDLQWSDPFGGSGNDYDLFVLNATGTAVLFASTDVQDGTQDPIEEIFNASGLGANNRIVVAKTLAASVRALHVDMFFGDSPLQIATDGATFGHNAAKSTAGTAAVYWNSARGGTRPFVGGAANPTETFSSDGPRKIFFKPDGTAITPGNVLFATGGGETLLKPDVSAADGVTTHTPGFMPFFGTSAAAPHAAAIAALVKSARPDYTNAQILNAMVQTALDIRAAGPDRDSGHGIVMALEAVNYALTH
jgi:hypothetical protein